MPIASMYGRKITYTKPYKSNKYGLPYMDPMGYVYLCIYSWMLSETVLGQMTMGLKGPPNNDKPTHFTGDKHPMVQT